MRSTTRYRSVRAVLTSAALCGALVATGGAAEARDGDVPTPTDREVLADGLVGPLSLAAGSRSTVYVSQNFAGSISSIRRGVVETVATAPAPGVELGSVLSSGSRLYYTTSTGAGDPAEIFDAHLVVQNRRGEVTEIADLGQHERDENPDGGTSYGFVDLPDECELPDGFPGQYTGARDSHPYASALGKHGEIFVADAGGNDVLAVDRHGDVRTVAVLPPAPLTVTEELAGAFGLPACVAGQTYLFESVPTDVEVGHDGWLYVTSLPGGPEGAGPVPPLGAVYKVDPESGETQLVARGFSGATNLALGRDGEIYVTELFAGRVSVIPHGSSTPQTFVEEILPSAVEVDGRHLYVTVESLPGDGAPPSGKVVRYDIRG